jgi:acetyltransferase-like isoleucine patch superfamily enzyme
MSSEQPPVRSVPATFARRPIEKDPGFERAQADHLRATYTTAELIGLYDRFRQGQGRFDGDMRRLLLRSLVASMGDDVTVGPDVGFLHPHTFHLDDGVFLGAGVFLQGRHDGILRIGRRCWIGPGVYLDARNLVIEECSGLGPGAKVLGSVHTGTPREQPIIETDLTIAPVRICRGADVGTGAIVLPGVTIGEGAIVGAGSVVHESVPPFCVALGNPARVVKTR